MDNLKNGAGPLLYRRAKQIIPGGTQLLSKRPETFVPEYWPAYYSKAKGCRVWDLDHREYIDMSIMGVGACVLGYADDEVDDAVSKAIRDGVSSTLNCSEEVQLAELMIELHPWFDAVRFARGGGEAMSIAVRIARAKTSRDLVLFSGYHGWADWYLASNLAADDALDGHLLPGLEPKGVPRGLLGTSIPFAFDDLDDFERKVHGMEHQVAAIVIEPARGKAASTEWLSHLRKRATEIGAILIFDEITSGFRICNGGAHRVMNIKPDVAVFAKGLANGYAMSAIMGTRSVMDSAQETFISSTNWTERVGPAAALATVAKFGRESVHEHLAAIGELFRSRLNEECPPNWKISWNGMPSLLTYEVVSPKGNGVGSELTLAMLNSGYLASNQFKASYAHQFSHVEDFSLAFAQALREVNEGTFPTTPKKHAGFARVTT